MRRDTALDTGLKAVVPASVSASCPASAAFLKTVGLWQQMAPIFQKCLGVYSRLPAQRVLQTSQVVCCPSFLVPAPLAS